MDSFLLRNREGSPITGWEGWVRPKESYQWKKGRSAMELARAWFREGHLSCPDELDSLLQSNAHTAGYNLVEGQPEFITPLPERGEGRNHDLWLRGRCRSHGLTICIEAKVDEPFGKLIGEEIVGARVRNAATRLPSRVKSLLQLLLGHPRDPLERPWCDLRYQLITALAGTAIQAALDGSGTAVFVVHEFSGSGNDTEGQRRNDKDLQEVLDLLMPGNESVVAGNLVGPIRLARRPELKHGTDLLVGKIRGPLPSSQI